ncbi:MAG: hypothetical protein JXA55_06040, partial [Bacteroidales bacterium]|nr:hypothetical protein [Bacteroidales bacterium]
MEKLKPRLFVYYVPAALLALVILTAFAISGRIAEENLKSRYSYNDFESSKKCRSCHPGTYEQWSQSLMSQAYTHHWDEIEYFDLAVRHAEVKPDLKEAVDGC